MDELDRRLLDLLQTDFPIIRTPFRRLADTLKVSEKDVLERTQILQETGIIRRFGISADSRKLGFVSTLVAARVALANMDEAIEQINSFPEVTHHYEREDLLNLWFTVIARNDQRKEQILERIRRLDGVVELMDLPATHVFKIRVNFPMAARPGPASGKGQDADIPGTEDQIEEIVLTKSDLQILRNLCDNFPITQRPFHPLALAAGLTEDQLICRLQQLHNSGHVRKLGAFLRHRRAGYNANGMVVWEVAEDKLDGIGRELAQQDRVTHAYARPTSEHWPYRLYTMLHGHSREEVCEEARRLGKLLGLEQYRILFSSRELKKTAPPLS